VVFLKYFRQFLWTPATIAIQLIHVIVLVAATLAVQTVAVWHRLKLLPKGTFYLIFISPILSSLSKVVTRDVLYFVGTGFDVICQKFLDTKRAGATAEMQYIPSCHVMMIVMTDEH